MIKMWNAKNSKEDEMRKNFLIVLVKNLVNVDGQ